VIVTATIEGAPARFVIVLSGGVVVAEQFSGGRGGTATKLVAPTHSPTYALEPGTSCWRQLATTDPQALTDIGQHFPETAGAANVGEPVRTRAGWLLSLTGHQRTATYSIVAGALHVTSVAVIDGGHRIVERQRALSAPPTLYAPSPKCAA
jgi:hypothetical protein